MKNALLTIGVAWAIELIYRILFLLSDFSWSINNGPDVLGSTVENFFFGVFIRPLFYFVPVFFALWFLLPVLKESTLWRNITRAAVAGIAGWVGLGLLGIIRLLMDSISFGFPIDFSGIAESLIWNSLINALGFTTQLVLGAVLAWLWISRERKVATVAPSSAPAVPPAA
jgi:hypothetical protein